MHTGTLARTALALTPFVLLAACGNEAPAPGGPGTAGNTQSVGGGSVGGAGTAGGAPPATGGANVTAGGGAGGVGTAGTGVSPTGGTATNTGGAAAGGSAGANTSGGGAGGGVVIGTCPYTPPADPMPFPADWTRGEVTVFNDNGGWTWYNDERVVVDAAAGKIVVSSAASSASSQTANRSIDVVIHDLATKQNTKKSLGSLSYSDDHNNGGIVVKAPGEYFAAYAHHNVDCNSYWSNYAAGSWSATVTHTWGGQGCPWNGSDITYNNVWKLSAEQGRLYNFVRSVETSPTFLYSDDNGANWTYGGRLTSSAQVGYNAGYYKYWGNGVDRIDFFATESHPRDSNTSLYHGYVKGGKVYDSFDKEVDANLMDATASKIQDYTRVFQAGSMLGGVALKRLWNFDVARYADGTIGVLWQGRQNECADKNNCTPGHHVAYSRFDGKEWKSTRLVKGGRTLYRNRSDWWEEDYLGGAALDPDDPHVIYVSTNVDPRDETKELPVNEIWKGVTCDNGATFVWTPMTMSSEHENLRPVVPKWDTENSALLWFRGNYQTAQMYSAEVVGIVAKR
jgi:hypothetical protein